jgi:hypothetical protein
MSPMSPQSDFSKKPIKRVRLLRIGPSKEKGLFEEYFYGFLLAIFLALFILLKAGGMDTSTALIVGLWMAGLTWFARQLKRYFKEKSEPPAKRQRAESPKGPVQPAKMPLSPNMKPIIGPQWPLKTGGMPGQAKLVPAPPNGQSKPAFVYERPTLPDRKPKLPANWPGRPPKKETGQQDKKPKR